MLSAVAPSMSEVAAELRAILERYPLPPEDADERDGTHWLIMKTGETLTRVANAVNGPPPPLTWWSHHDLGEKTEAMAEELRLHKVAISRVCRHHPREVIAVHENAGEEAWCPTCKEHFPCMTIRALEDLPNAAQGN